MALPLLVAIKDFLGLYVLTPFERALLERLGEAMTPDDRETLSFQLANFTTVRRCVKPLGSLKAFGFTEFHTTRFGKVATDARQTKRFVAVEREALLARARVIFDGGEIDVQFWLVRGVLFSMKYRSPQGIYYPPDEYCIESIVVWPRSPN